MTSLIRRYSGAVVYDAACLTDCSQPASEVGRQPEQQEFNDQEDGEETKEEARLGFMDFPVRDVAEQLTRLDAVGLVKPLLNMPLVLRSRPSVSQDLFVRVVPFHCLGCIWSQRDKKENRNLAPTVRATISQFNAVTNRVITSLLCPFAPGPLSSSPASSPRSSSTFPYSSADLGSPDSAHTSPAHRARIIERWISIAQVWTQNRDCWFICSSEEFDLFLFGFVSEGH